jgi:hypothetical protein
MFAPTGNTSWTCWSRRDRPPTGGHLAEDAMIVNEAERSRHNPKVQVRAALTAGKLLDAF